jgi:hypothetical protein
MKDIKEYEKDLASIRSIMEKSVKFISLSGLSGVLAGLYALTGAVIAYKMIYYPIQPFGYFQVSLINHPSSIFKLELTALLVLVASLATGFLMSLRKARKLEVSLWNATSKQVLKDLLIPLASGGLFILMLLMHGYYILIAPSCLIFYGMALVQVSRSTYREVIYLGLTEIGLGILSAALPGYGLILWAIGFGIMHIIYGSVMYFRYEQ